MLRSLSVAGMALMLTGPALGQSQNPCAGVPGADEMVELQSTSVSLPYNFGIGPDWQMAVHPGMPSSPFLIPSGWQAIMLQPAMHANLIRLVRDDGLAEVDWLFGSEVIQGFVGTPATAVASDMLYGDGQVALTPVCSWNGIQPPFSIDASVQVARGNGVLRGAQAFVFPGSMGTYAVTVVAASEEEFAEVVHTVLVPIQNQFSKSGGSSSDDNPCPPGQELIAGQCFEQD